MRNFIHTILLGCLFFSLKIGAQVYLAGDIAYRWISGYTYEIKVTNFTKTGTGGLPDACQETLCDGTVINRSNGPSIICAGTANDGVLISPSIKMNEYITTHTYPGPGYYALCSDEANRISGIINIPNSVNQTMYLETPLIISTFTGHNSSPVFANFPLAHGCLNNACFTYNPLATDADGDSLSYELAGCSGNSGSPISGYSYPGAGAGGTFSINPVTGLLTWCNPQFPGDYNVVIRIKEWRKNSDGDYVLIGVVNRDTQFTIESCTGISDIVGKDQNISVYPNPVTDYLEIKFSAASNEIYTVELTDVTGQTVASLLKDSAMKPSMTFNMKELGNGIYFVKISGKNKTIIKKLIKQ